MVDSYPFTLRDTVSAIEIVYKNPMIVGKITSKWVNIFVDDIMVIRHDEVLRILSGTQDLDFRRELNSRFTPTGSACCHYSTEATALLSTFLQYISVAVSNQPLAVLAR